MIIHVYNYIYIYMCIIWRSIASIAFEAPRSSSPGDPEKWKPRSARAFSADDVDLLPLRPGRNKFWDRFGVQG